MSKYEKFTLADLKKELRKRKARLSGRKQELIQRLEAYDRNANFMDVDDLVADKSDWKMILPEPHTFRDVTSASNLPPVSELDVMAYLQQHGTALDSSASKLYNSRFLLFIRWSYNDKLFIASRCRAEMRKDVTYNVHVCLENCGTINSCQCECAAGMGPSAHCKHIRALLYGLVQFCSGNCLQLELTCTEALQTFHHPKQRHFGSPIRSTALQLGNVKSQSVIFDPVPSALSETAKDLNCRVRNETVNYAASTYCSVPLLQCLTPGSISGFNNDHDYLKFSPADNFLISENISPVGISVFDAVDIERKTRDQSSSKQWHTERLKRLQSSKFGRIVKATTKTDFVKLAVNLMTPKDAVFAKSLAHGRKYETIALRNYEQVKGVTVTKCGILVDNDRPYLGCSPDGLVGTNRVVEVKCPYSAKDANISPESVPYLELDDQTGLLRLSSLHDYMFQVQGLLHISRRDVCDFVVFTLQDMVIIEVHRDEEFVSHMLLKLSDFFVNVFSKQYLCKHFFKD